MTLPEGARQLTKAEEIHSYWGDLLTTSTTDADGSAKLMYDFADNSRVAVTDEAIYVELRKPVHAGERAELTQVLEIKEPVSAVLRAADTHKGDIAKTSAIIGAHLNIPSVEIDRMPVRDYKLVAEVIGRFLIGLE